MAIKQLGVAPSSPVTQAFGDAANVGIAGDSPARASHRHGMPTHLAVDHSAIPLSALAAAVADILMGGNKLTKLGAPVGFDDAATRGYVDAVAQGFIVKTPVVCATTTQLTLATVTTTTLTQGSSYATLSLDGINPQVGDRVLVKDGAGSLGSAQKGNGIYTVTNVGSGSTAWVLTRATDFDADADIPYAFVSVQRGTVNAGASFQTTIRSGIIGSSNISWGLVGANRIGAGVVPIGGCIWSPVSFYGDLAWLLCDGTIFNTTTYAALFSLLGGNTLPDLVNYSPAGTGLAAAGATAGAKTSSGVGSHGHSTGTESVFHQHGPGSGTAFVNGGGANNAGITQTGASFGQILATGNQSVLHVHAVNPTGGDYSILNPVRGGYWYMRAL